MTTNRNPDHPNRRSTLAAGRLLATLLVLAIISTACGRFTGDGDTSTQAQVSVNGVESGCAEAIGLSILMTGAPQPSLTIEDMRRFAGGATAIEPMFSESAEATEYAGVVTDIASAAADAAEARDSVNAEQISLLVEVEKVGRRADLERLTPAADTFFAQNCGSEYRTAADTEAEDTAALAAAAAVQATQESASSSVDETVSAVVDPAPEASTTTTETEPAGPAPVLVVDDSSVGATGTYLSLEFELGEIWRTNLTPQAAIEGGSELGDGEIVMVGIKVTSPGASVFTTDSDFGLTTEADGRTNADDSVSATGSDWDTRVDGNETRRGFLIFPGRVGDLTDGKFQIGGDDDEVESIPLGQAAASSPYPVIVASGQTSNVQLSNGNADCQFPIESEIRSASITLDAQGNVSMVRAGRNERFLTVDVAMKVGTLGSPCGSVLYMNLTDMRLQLDNGDIIGPVHTDGRIDEASTGVIPLSFRVPKDVTSAELIDETGTPLASWTDLALPDA